MKTNLCTFALFITLDVGMLLSFTTLSERVPQELAGKWQKGSFPMVDFFTFNGRTPQSADSSFALSLSTDGQAELYQYVPGFDGTCRSHTLAYVKCIVQVDGDQLTLTGQSGQYRGVFEDACGQNFERPMTPSEVNKYVFKFYWSRKQRDGEDYLVVQPTGRTQGGDYFAQVFW